jgi:hypothetical protein
MVTRQRIPIPSDSPEEDSYLEALQASLDEYRWILDEEENWDGEGIARVEEPTFDRAVRFIVNHSAALFEAIGFRLDAPRLSIGPTGSIDAHWEYPDREMTANFSPLASAPVAYYFRNDAGARSRGSAVLEDTQPNILSLLVK